MLPLHCWQRFELYWKIFCREIKSILINWRERKTIKIRPNQFGNLLSRIYTPNESKNISKLWPFVPTSPKSETTSSKIKELVPGRLWSVQRGGTVSFNSRTTSPNSELTSPRLRTASFWSKITCPDSRRICPDSRMASSDSTTTSPESRTSSLNLRGVSSNLGTNR